MLAGFIVAIIVAVHVIGGSPTSTPPSPAHDNSSHQPTGTAGSAGAYLPPIVETASALGMSPTTLLADIHSGKTVPEIAEAQHVPIATVNAAYLHGVQDMIEQNGNQGAGSQSAANTFYQLEEQQVQSGHYDLLQGSNGGSIPIGTIGSPMPAP